MIPVTRLTHGPEACCRRQRIRSNLTQLFICPKGLPFSDLERDRLDLGPPVALVVAGGRAQQEHDVRITQNRHEKCRDSEQTKSLQPSHIGRFCGLMSRKSRCRFEPPPRIRRREIGQGRLRRDLVPRARNYNATVGVARIRAVAEVVLNARDIGSMRRVYEDVLGFRLHSQIPESETTIVFLTICDRGTALARGGHPEMLVLIDPVRHPGAKDLFDVVGRRGSTLNHLAFEIDEGDYDDAREQLKALHLPCKEHEFLFLQAKALFFEDPEGNILELICHDNTAEVQ